MGDMGDIYREYDSIKKERHARWNEENRRLMDESDIQFEIRNNGECLTTPLKASLYPSTGRWTYKGKTYSGGAKGFIRWYHKKEKE